MSPKIKDHFKRHKTLYISIGCVAVGIGIAVLTGRIMKNLDQRDFIVLPRRDFIVPDVKGSIVNYGPNNGIVGNVSYISANRQGPPSWVIRCLETGQLYTSQNSAAETMGLSKSNVSRHLNGLLETAEGYHFERICMAA